MTLLKKIQIEKKSHLKIPIELYVIQTMKKQLFCSVTSTFPQYGEICFRKSSGSNMGMPNLLRAIGAK